MADVKTKRNENRVTVVDPEGNYHEVSQRNANDLVQHAGWTVAAQPSLTDANAHAPRQRRARQTVADKIADKQEKKPARKRAAPAPQPVDLEDDTDPVPYDQQVDATLNESDVDELEALEAEEDARSPKDDTAE